VRQQEGFVLGEKKRRKLITRKKPIFVSAGRRVVGTFYGIRIKATVCGCVDRSRLVEL